MSDAKIPREWLLARHANAKPRLDEARRAALPASDLSWRDFLGEIFRPHRTAWRGLALVWLGLLAFHFTLGRSAHPPVTPPPPEAVAAWLAQLKANETFAQIDRHP